MNLNRKKHNTTFADRVLLLLLAFSSLYSFIFIKEVIPEGSFVRIEVSGRLQYSLPLYVDKEVEVDGPLGKAIVEIKGGKVRMKEAPCNNKICIHQGWINSGAIVCLPNRVVVIITGTNNKDIDGITG
ncbi:MAG: NusG domain II-containing protein [Nitrospirae bacterium]|nr:NusG domain II-containing protein [Nitrospirota bacterium]